MKISRHINTVFVFMSVCVISPHIFAQQDLPLRNVVIEGEVDLKTTEEIKNTLAEIKEKNEKIEADILALQDKIAKKYTNKVKISISLLTQNKENEANFGIIQLTGAMNHLPLIEYDHPLILEKNQPFALFEGVLPTGKYEFKLTAVVGQQVKKWPFVLPEGKWNLEKRVSIDAQAPDSIQKIEIVLAPQAKTGVPQFVCPVELVCR